MNMNKLILFVLIGFTGTQLLSSQDKTKKDKPVELSSEGILLLAQRLHKENEKYINSQEHPFRAMIEVIEGVFRTTGARKDILDEGVFFSKKYGFNTQDVFDKTTNITDVDSYVKDLYKDNENAKNEEDAFKAFVNCVRSYFAYNYILNLRNQQLDYYTNTFKFNPKSIIKELDSYMYEDRVRTLKALKKLIREKNISTSSSSTSVSK